MKRGHQGYVAVGLPVSAETRDPSRLTEQAFDSCSTKADEGFGLNDIDLFVQEGDACLHLFWGWLPIAGGAGGHIRPALENVRDINSFAREAHGFDDFSEELTGAA